MRPILRYMLVMLLEVLLVGCSNDPAHCPAVFDPPSILGTETNFPGWAYIKPSSTHENDYFGSSISLSADTLAIGVPGEDSSATGTNGEQKDSGASGSGAVFVFHWTGSMWVQEAYLKASNTDANDVFGSSVSLHGNTLAVGAPSESSGATGVNGNQSDNSAMNSGAVYVFERSGTTWVQQAYLKASNAETGDAFGSSVSLYGNTLSIGARNEDSGAAGIGGNQADNGAMNSGAVYVFQRTGSVWTQQAYLKASNAQAGDTFGSTVSMSGDSLAVAAPNEDSKSVGVNGDQADNSAISSGAVYLFIRNGTNWTQQAYLKASNSDIGDRFGFSVSLSGDNLAVGAVFERSAATGVNGNQADNSVAEEGAVYMFQRTSSAWTQKAYLKPSNTGWRDWFGWAVSLSGDRLAVGAKREAGGSRGVNGNQLDNSAPTSGAVYVFQQSAGNWAQIAYVKASNAESGDEFGHSVSISGSNLAAAAASEAGSAPGINGDQADNGAPRSGAVYIVQPPAL